ncbi:type VI secretion system-associated FHA domain protein TagH, partial [Mesorhizobium sp. M2C.T.Ca.TU.009.01.2.1]
AYDRSSNQRSSPAFDDPFSLDPVATPARAYRCAKACRRSRTGLAGPRRALRSRPASPPDRG